MSSDEYQVQNIYKYARKSYKNGRKASQDNCSPQVDANIESDNSPRSNDVVMDQPGCSCDAAHEDDVASILHKKCPVITLARQQLRKILDDTDKILCDNSRCCRSMYDFLCICQELFRNKNKLVCMFIFFIGFAFLCGLIVGAASCGSYLGKFNSPIITCIDKFFIFDTHTNSEEFRGIV